MRKRRSAKRAPIISEKGLQATLEAQTGIHAVRNRAIMYASHYLGLRAIELAGLTIGDVYDPHLDDIREVIRLTVTKGDVFREVPLMNQTARESFRAMLAKRRKRLEAPLFLSQKGCAFSADTMQKLIKRMYQKAHVSGSSHSGRRTCATRLHREGMDVIYLMGFLGHANIATTQRYIQTDLETMKFFASKLR